jgi:hypothetical protein
VRSNLGKLSLSVQNDAVSKVDWVGHPWVIPALIWLTIEVIALAIALTWVELIAKLAFTAVGGHFRSSL